MTCCARSASTRRCSPIAIRTNCRAASASASTSPARSRWRRAWCCSTRRCRRSTSRSRRRCSIFCSTSRTNSSLTYVFISHDLNVVRFISDRVIVMYLGEVVEQGPVEALWSDARHPYTRALLASMPSLDPDKRTGEAPIAGDPPNPIDPPSGCRFHTRCPFAESVCSAVSPEADRHRPPAPCGRMPHGRPDVGPQPRRSIVTERHGRDEPDRRDPRPLRALSRRAHRACGQRRRPHARRRRGARADRRVGLGQERDLAGAAAPAPRPSHGDHRHAACRPDATCSRSTRARSRTCAAASCR